MLDEICNTTLNQCPLEDFSVIGEQMNSVLSLWDMVRDHGICTGVTPYLAISVPRPPVLRVLALALAFLLPSVGKFAQQRLRGCCREGERGQNHVRRTVSCDPSEGQKPI